MAENQPMHLSIESLGPWATLNGVELNDVELATIPSRGNGIKAKRELTAAEETGDVRNLLTVPGSLVLSANTVAGYAQEDGDFKKLLDAAGSGSTRDGIMLFLLVQLAILRNGETKPYGLSNPWTAYLRFLPPEISSPTLWTEGERVLLKGTSLETAVNGKMLALEREFDRIREISSDIPCWQAMFWDNMTVNLRTWFVIDAWYRSRSLELPKSGEALVPCLDMVNHSGKPNAYFEETENEVVLRLGNGCLVSEGDEVTISYGSDKGVAEMLYNYGFIPEDAPRNVVRVNMEPFDDDPLRTAKLVVFGRRPVLVLTETNHKTEWVCPFSFLKCVNFEDGLAFKIAQETDGGQQLRVFWEGRDVTESAGDFATVVSSHDLWPLFLLRVITDIQDQVRAQLERMESDQTQHDIQCGVFREGLLDAGSEFRSSEGKILETAVRNLEIERELQTAHVQQDQGLMTYLGKMDVARNVVAEEALANEDDDFS